MNCVWKIYDDSHPWSTLSPSFMPIAWGKGGVCLASPTFRPPFPHPSYHCLGQGWGLPGFSHLSPTLFPSFISIAWGKGGVCLASPTFRPHLIHPSYPLPGARVGGAWLLPPFAHLLSTLSPPFLLSCRPIYISHFPNKIKKGLPKAILSPFHIISLSTNHGRHSGRHLAH